MSDERLTALVLAADDDEDILELVKIVLEEDGYQVVTAPNGKKALEMATEMIPDLCVFDVMMPKMDGCEATRQMRADERTRDIPILLLSARTQWEAVMKGKEAGADEYITKPFVPDDLQRSVRGMLAAPTPPAEDPVLGMMEGGIEPGGARGGSRPRGLVLVAGADANLVKLVGYRLELGGFEVGDGPQRRRGGAAGFASAARTCASSTRRSRRSTACPSSGSTRPSASTSCTWTSSARWPRPGRAARSLGRSP